MSPWPLYLDGLCTPALSSPFPGIPGTPIYLASCLAPLVGPWGLSWMSAAEAPAPAALCLRAPGLCSCPSGLPPFLSPGPAPSSLSTWGSTPHGPLGEGLCDFAVHAAPQWGRISRPTVPDGVAPLLQQGLLLPRSREGVSVGIWTQRRGFGEGGRRSGVIRPGPVDPGWKAGMQSWGRGC